MSWCTYQQKPNKGIFEYVILVGVMNISDLLAKYDISTPRCGAHCGDGWVPLIESLIIDLIALGWDKKLSQVKEKFGGLRFYIDESGLSRATMEVVTERIREAEDKSMTVCETCGEPGSPHGSYWLKTVCPECSGKKEQLEKERQNVKQ